MNFFEAYGKEIFAVVVAAIPWMLDRFKGKARLQYSQSHSHTFLVQQQLFNPDGELMREVQTACTRSFVVYNSGRETSTKVEIVFNWKPICNILPLRHHTEHLLPDGRYAIVFDSLSPKESVSVHILSVNADLPVLATVRCDQTVAQYVDTHPMPVVGRFRVRVFTALFYIGIFTCVYMLLLGLQKLGLIPATT
ncbi:hypothetical protein HX881_30990 [Pseudomonas gingeri]|uniref:hypothetical protein n=1 Tax=Pseudomonas gingeri TaxID=117681 RepID=UPI0015A19D1E|nr:hypothetical protein [Pseudomonas gingeri]NVZ30015.1 hypothetical protein [Pseudomonas gingeri]